MALMYGWMIFVEHAPERYDWAVKVMTAGRLDRIKDQIAAEINEGDRVLDIGCGTATLALRCIKRGAVVIGVDSSASMLEQAEKNAVQELENGSLTLIKDSVTQLKRFPDGTFDAVTATMVLGEFPPEYLRFILRDCYRVLRPSGQLFIADEVWPRHRLTRVCLPGGDDGLLGTAIPASQTGLLSYPRSRISHRRSGFRDLRVTAVAGYELPPYRSEPDPGFDPSGLDTPRHDWEPRRCENGNRGDVMTRVRLFFWELFHIFFRHYNFPCALGLRKLGNPNEDSPVFLSGNYTLTVYRLERVLRGLDCFLLVANSRGSNVWCAAGMNEYSEHDVIDAVNVADLGAIVKHRRLIAPPYAAPGVNAHAVREETGFRIIWGPTHLNDLRRYVANGFRRTDDMARVQFGFQDRLEQALSTALAYSMTIAVLLIFWPAYIIRVMGLILVTYLYGFCLWNVFPEERRWRRTITIAVSLSAPLLTLAAMRGWSLTDAVLWEATLLVVVALMAMDCCGSSPLYKSTVSHWLHKGDYHCDFNPVIDPDMCTNCLACQIVCPTDVFARRREGTKKMVVVRPDNCIECMACVKQCDDEAIFNRTGRYKGDVKSIPKLDFLMTRDWSHLADEDQWIGLPTTVSHGRAIVIESNGVQNGERADRH